MGKLEIGNETDYSSKLKKCTAAHKYMVVFILTSFFSTALTWCAILKINRL